MAHPRISRSRRYTIAEVLHTNNVHLAVIQHELWRIVNVHEDSLTPKEQEYLQKRLATLEGLAVDLGRFNTHMRKGL
jgi:hypothetical protein